MYSNPFLHRIKKLAQQDKTVLVNGSQSITAKELLQNSTNLAIGLKSKGMTEMDISIIATIPGVQFLEIVFATMMIGSKVAIIDPDMGRDNYRAKMNQLKPKWAFVDYRLLLLQEHPILRLLYFKLKKDGLYIPFSKSYTTIATGKYLPILQKHFSQKKLIKKYSPTPSDKRQEIDKDYEYIVTYTSGTVNEPKGVLHSIQTLYKSILHIIKLLGDTSNQRIVTHLPHYMLIGVCAGIEVHIWDDAMKPSEKLSFIKRHQITTLFLPPSDLMILLKECIKQSSQMPECLRHIMLGSAPVHAVFLEKLMPFLHKDTRVTCMYGMTENLIISAIDGREKINYTTKGDVLGKPLEGVKIKSSSDGEILVSSNQLFKRYLHLPNREEWHATGDMGYVDENGYLILTGRKKDMIIRRNFNIYPALYEPTIKKIAGIDEAVLIGVYDEKIADEKVYLCVESQDKLHKKELEKAVSKGNYSIDKEARPDDIIFCEIPRRGRQNKIDRNALRVNLKSIYHA